MRLRPCHTVSPDLSINLLPGLASCHADDLQEGRERAAGIVVTAADSADPGHVAHDASITTRRRTLRGQNEDRWRVSSVASLSFISAEN